MKEIESAFGEVTKLLLGSELTVIDDYGDWLGRHVPLPTLAKSAVSGTDVWIPPTLNYLGIEFNKSKVISMEEMDKVTSSPFTAKEIETANLKELTTKFMKPVAYFCGNFRYQTYENFEKVSGGGGGRNVYVGEDVFLGVKNIGFSNYTLFSESMFGCYAVTHSQFNIHVYRSFSLARCFEVDSSSNCHDLFFSHNCENVNDSMFCFNAKNLRHAIGNIQLAPEIYKEIKAKIMAGIVKELKETKNLRYNIFNIGDPDG
ncbi:MAG: hypothetical protein Q7S22_03385 [Candidatus Micrarchaeota archaeon]|nr:hypothetical protein [Candidatus Micrarchaeota archaeon]